METLHYLLMKSHSQLNRRIVAEAAQAGLTSGQPKILEYLWRYGENNQKAIADYCEIEQATAGTILTGMETAGLIMRERRDGNRRSLYVKLTDQGETAAKRMEQIFQEQEKLACERMDQEEVQQLRELLDKFCMSLQFREEAQSHEA